MMTKQHIWVIEHPTNGLLLGMGTNAHEAWENSLTLLDGKFRPYNPWVHNRTKQALYKEGWRARHKYILD